MPTLRISPPIVIKPKADPACPGYMIAHEPTLDMHLLGRTIAEIRNEAIEELFFLWHHYAHAPSKKLSKDAIELKAAIRARISKAR